MAVGVIPITECNTQCCQNDRPAANSKAGSSRNIKNARSYHFDDRGHFKGFVRLGDISWLAGARLPATTGGTIGRGIDKSPDRPTWNSTEAGQPNDAFSGRFFHV
jgi:hypothetical protein